MAFAQALWKRFRLLTYEFAKFAVVGIVGVLVTNAVYDLLYLHLGMGPVTSTGAKSVPFKTIKTLPGGSELVLLRESGSMLGKRRREHQGKTLPRLPDTVARLVSFTVTTRTARRVKTSVIKVLTTLLDPQEFPAAEIAALYAQRRQINDRPVESPESGHTSRKLRAVALSVTLDLLR